MSPLIALQVLALSVTGRAACAARSRLQQLRSTDREAGLSTLEIAVIALGLFLLAGVAVLALTTATNSRLQQIQ